MIVVAATFVAEPLKGPLSCVLGEVGIREDIVFAPYNQVFQQLLDPTSELGQNVSGTSILLVRVEDFVRDQPDLELAIHAADQVVRDLGNALEKFSGGIKGALIFVALPPGPSVSPTLAPTLISGHRALLGRVAGLPGIHVLDDTQIDAVGADDPYDTIRDQLAHIPYSDAYFAALALTICRRIHAISMAPAKVLVLDCDNTLWRGVVGEDGVGGIELSDPYLALQDFAIQRHARGVLLCLVSKNVEADVLSVLEKRREMRLGVRHVVAYRINWQPKPANIRELAAELNLGLDAFVFLDDNPVECAQMRAELPQVVTLQVPPAPEIKSFLSHLWVLDKLTVTTEDANRTQMYRENAARRAMESSADDIGKFMAALDLKIDITPPSDEEWSRVEQLTQRTNQFNFTTHRRSVLELKALQSNGAHIFRIRVSDRFGDYGLVGVMVAEQSGAELLVDTFLLSCRVLGRGVEHAMLQRLGHLAESLRLDTVLLRYVPTARNVPARAFADSVASEFFSPSADGVLYRLPTTRAVGIEHRPGYDPVEVIEARVADEKKSIGPASPTMLDRSERYSRLAHALVSGQALLDYMGAKGRRRRSMTAQSVEPASSAEAQLLRIWEEVLGIEGLGV
jgi:FkbH-like protein